MAVSHLSRLDLDQVTAQSSRHGQKRHHLRLFALSRRQPRAPGPAGGYGAQGDFSGGPAAVPARRSLSWHLLRGQRRRAHLQNRRWRQGAHASHGGPRANLRRGRGHRRFSLPGLRRGHASRAVCVATGGCVPRHASRRSRVLLGFAHRDEPLGAPPDGPARRHHPARR